MNNFKKWFGICFFAFLFIAFSPVFAKKIAKPYWSLGAIKKATLTLKNGNLDCSPYDCTIPLKPNQTLTVFKSNTFDLHDRPKYNFGGPHGGTPPKEHGGHHPHGGSPSKEHGHHHFSSKSHIFALHDHGKVIEYYFYTSDFVKIPGYSGDPINLELSITPGKRIVFTRLIAMNEPIFIEGIPVSKLSNDLKKFKGLVIDQPNSERSKKLVSVDVITGATVTSHVMAQTIISSSNMVARRVGIIKNIKTRKIKISQKFTPLTWKKLSKLGAIGHLKVMPQEMGLPKSDTPWVDIYFANVSIPIIGRNLLGDTTYYSLKKTLKPDESLILIINNGKWSFKGSAFARGGIFDRFAVKQGFNTYTFRDTDYLVLYGGLQVQGSPSFIESGMFKLPSSKFQVGETWEFILMASRLTGKTAVSKEYRVFSSSYTLPPSFYSVEKTNIVVKQIKKLSYITQLWKSDWLSVAWYIFLWLFVIAIFTFKGYLSRSKKVIDGIHFGVLITSFVTVGIYQHGQPSVVNVTTFVNMLINQNSWNIYLRDPYLFVGWILIMLTVLIWGRTLFCGWLCPFGAIQEILFKVRTWVTPFKKSYDFKPKYQKNIKYLSYVIFLIIFIISIFSFQMSEIVADKIEPFKTIWNVGILHRPIGYGLYIAVLLSIGVFSYRFFCRYLCPLGGGLALLSFFPLWRIKRRNTCTSCKICATDCPALAITKKGKVDMKSCFGYFACITNMFNKKRCPPLLSKKLWTKNKEKDIKYP